MTNSNSAIASAALPLITQISARAWKVITADTPRGQDEEVELQPQPLPPVEQFEIAAAIMTHRFAQMAIESEIQGRPASRIINDMVDDWCGTPPWPRNWPRPVPGSGPEPGPRPNEAADQRLVQAGRIVGALVLANFGSRLVKGQLGEALLSGAERLTNAALVG